MYTRPLNPHYNASDLGLELYTVEEGGMSYEYNMLDFWATDDGRVYSASDAGCSCPTPFEAYAGGSQAEVLKHLERVGSVEQAEVLFDNWNDRIGKWGRKCDLDDKRQLAAWVQSKLHPPTRPTPPPTPSNTQYEQP